MVFSGVGGDGRRDSSGVIVQWSAPPPAGEAVSEGDLLCEVETGKAEITMDCDQDTVVARILVSLFISAISVFVVSSFVIFL